MIASGEVIRCSREENSDLFWATVGGMGLTGVILELEIRMRRVESAYLEGEVIRAGNVDSAIEAFERTEAQYGYSVAWIDCNSSKSALGRSVLNLGNFATLDRLPQNLAQDPLSTMPKLSPLVPFDFPGFALNSLSVKAFNAAIYAFHRERAANTIFDWESFFYPLDSIRNWNRIYGKRGFVQYQSVWPLDQSRAGLIEVLEAISRSGRASFLTVLKKLVRRTACCLFRCPVIRSRSTSRWPTGCSNSSIRWTRWCSSAAGACTWPKTRAWRPRRSARCIRISPRGRLRKPSPIPTTASRRACRAGLQCARRESHTMSRVLILGATSPSRERSRFGSHPMGRNCTSLRATPTKRGAWPRTSVLARE